MSYRTYVNNRQIFGNDECYPEWIKFIESQGIQVDEDGRYEGELTDFMAAMEAIENIVLDIEAGIQKDLSSMTPRAREATRLHSLFDLGHIKKALNEVKNEADYWPHLFDELYDTIECGYLFMPVVFYDACRDDLELDVRHPNRFRAYKLKPGKTIHISAG